MNELMKKQHKKLKEMGISSKKEKDLNMTDARGITLIALVVTIIVLLILAGISIMMLTGQTGILKNAQQAREETVKGQIKEDVQRDIMEKMIEGKKGDITPDELYEILKEYFDLEASEIKGPNEYEEGKENPWEAKDFPDSFPELHSKEGDYTFKLGDIYSGTLSGTSEEPTKETAKTVSELKAGDYVDYVYEKDDGSKEKIPCRVFYDNAYNVQNETDFGVQLISCSATEESVKLKDIEPHGSTYSIEWVGNELKTDNYNNKDLCDLVRFFGSNPKTR